MNIPQRYTIRDTPTGTAWACLECQSTGSHPHADYALVGAQTHYRSFHTSQETTVNPTPKRRRPTGWWHAIARLFTIPNTPRRAER